MANLPTSPVIVPADPNVEGENSGMNGGGSDSVIGICTDVPNPKESDWDRVVIGATKNPIGHPAEFQSLVEYEADTFDGSPVGFAPADTIAAPGEVYATNVEGTGWSLTNKTEDYTTKEGDWLWGVAGGSVQPACKYYDCASLANYIEAQAPELFWKYDQGGPVPTVGNNDVIRSDGAQDWPLQVNPGNISGNDPEYTVGASSVDLCGGTTWHTGLDPILHTFQTQQDWADPAVSFPARSPNVTLGGLANRDDFANQHYRVGCTFRSGAQGTYHEWQVSREGGFGAITASYLYPMYGASWRMDNYMTAQELSQKNYHLITMEASTTGTTTHYVDFTWYCNGTKRGDTIRSTDERTNRTPVTYYYLYGVGEADSYLGNTFADDVLWTASQIAGLEAAIAQNSTNYVDPNPNCIPP